MNKVIQNIEQNKKIVAIFIATMVLVITVSIPSLAYTDSSTNNVDFSDQPFVGVEHMSSSSEIVVGYSSDNTPFRVRFTTSNDFYIFTYNNPVSSGKYRFAVVSDLNSKGTLYFVSSGSGFTCDYRVDNNYDYYYATPSNSYISDFSTLNGLPNFSSLEDGLSAVLDWIVNPSEPSVEPRAINYTIPAGYAFVADITGLTPTGMVKTATSKAYPSPHVSNQTIAYVDSIPTIGNNPIGNGISWDGVGNKDLFGRYKSWQHNLVPNPTKNYLVVYNPVHIDNYVDPEHEDYNSSIVISLSEARSGQLIALNTELTSSGQVETVTTDNTGYITYDDETDSWVTTNPDGTPYNPSPYGDYLPNTQNSIHDWLENISNQISGFFNGAIGAITNLVSAGSSFFQVLLGLYSWLPISVLSVLSSALIIVITIGVIKVFL